MSLSVREQVLAALFDRLSALKPAAVKEVYRNRRKPIADQNLPALVMQDGGQSVPEELAGYTEYLLSAEIEGYVKAASDEDLGPAVSALYAATLAALMADRTLGGLAVDMIEGDVGIDLDRDLGSSPAGAFLLTVSVRFWTKPADPYTVGP